MGEDRGQLGDREDEDEVEEQLQGRDPDDLRRTRLAPFG
jgi:hypothetical protein